MKYPKNTSKLTAFAIPSEYQSKGSAIPGWCVQVKLPPSTVMKEEKTLFEKLYEAGEEHLARFAKDVLSHPTFSSAMEKAFRNAATTKGKVDRNLDTLLNLLNIPSKADYTKLLAKVEAVQGSLVNLNIKLDRLLAQKERVRKVSRHRTRRSRQTSERNGPAST